jgi:hypothetical protein
MLRAVSQRETVRVEAALNGDPAMLCSAPRA